jgi:hypothetical protein
VPSTELDIGDHASAVANPRVTFAPFRERI